MVDNDEKISVADAMTKHGGSFVRSLGQSIYHADPINTQKIHDAFYGYWQEYKKIAEQTKD